MSNMETMGDKAHSHNSNCIYSAVNLMGTLSSSLCQMLIKSSWLYSGLGVSSLTTLDTSICYLVYNFFST